MKTNPIKCTYNHTSIQIFTGTTHNSIGAPWIGLGDAATEGEFVYDSDGKPPKFNHFFTDQPNNSHPGKTRRYCEVVK